MPEKPYIEIDGKAFVHCRGTTFICIGTLQEVSGAEDDPVRLGKLIMRAIAVGEYNNIHAGKGRTKQ